MCALACHSLLNKQDAMNPTLFELKLNAGSYRFSAMLDGFTHHTMVAHLCRVRQAFRA